MAVDENLKIELGKQGVFVTTIEELYNWGRRSSIWPMQFGLACCAIDSHGTAMPLQVHQVEGELAGREKRHKVVPGVQ